MGQVRKDILNGWKEIGGYVCRDIRTVERWEKQRGLPVRRVPGAGRATVYALIPELDEWLEKSKPERPEITISIDDLGSDPEPDFDAAPEPIWLQMDSANPSQMQFPAAYESVDHVGSRDAAMAVATTDLSDKPTKGSNAWFTSGHHKWIAGITIATAVGLLCILASPLVRSHADPVAEPAKYSLDPVAKSAKVPYRSQVPGVDDLYLKGIYFYEQRTPESLQRSLDDFSGAIAKDPNYAPAYAGLSNSYNLLREYAVMPEAQAYAKARAAAEHAVALDPNLAQAHAALGFVDFFWSWDTAGAEREFKTALALDPSSVLAHHWYGSMLTHEGRFSEAIEQLDLAQRLQPTSAAVLSTRALALGLSGHRGEAVDMLQDVVNETPGVSSPHAILAILSKVEPRDPARFLDETRKVGQLRHSDELLQVAAAAEPAYRSGGEDAMWKSILSTEVRLHPGPSNRTFLMVQAEAALGDKDTAFADMNQLAQRRDPAMIGIVVDPTLAPLRRDRRFGELVASIGLPPLPR